MAVSNLKTLDGVYAMAFAPRVLGEGAIENTDELAVDVIKYPLGTQYLNITAGALQIRTAVDGVAADYVTFSHS
jgi:hypothetical protein